jgi:hypothetical protein
MILQPPEIESIARSQGRVVNALALGKSTGIGAVACDSCCGSMPALLCHRHYSHRSVPKSRCIKSSQLEAILGRLLLSVCRRISGSNGQAYDRQIAIVVNTPQDFDGVPPCIGDDWSVSIVCGWLTVVNADTGVVAARALLPTRGAVRYYQEVIGARIVRLGHESKFGLDGEQLGESSRRVRTTSSTGWNYCMIMPRDQSRKSVKATMVKKYFIHL